MNKIEIYHNKMNFCFSSYKTFVITKLNFNKLFMQKDKIIIKYLEKL